MKHKGKILAAVVAGVALLMVAATYFGSVTVVNTMHGETNYFTIVQGNHQASVVRKISPSNTVDVLNANGNFKVVTNCQVTIQIANGGSAITASQYGVVRIPNTFTVTGWDIVGEPSGSVVVDLWTDTYANFPPTVADTCAGSEKPTLTTAIKNQDVSITTWNTTLTNAYYLKWNVDSATTVTNVSVFIYGVAQ